MPSKCAYNTRFENSFLQRMRSASALDAWGGKGREIVSSQLKQLPSPRIYFIVFIQIATVFPKKIIFEVSRYGELLAT